MAELSSDQVLFVLKVLGRDRLYSSGHGFLGEDFEQSFLREINNSLAEVAIQLAQLIQLSYDLDQSDQPLINQEITIEDLQTMVENVGMIIPASILELGPAQALSYFQQYGHLYRSFSSSRKADQTSHWDLAVDLINGSVDPQELNFSVFYPTMTDYDLYLNPFLRTHLRDLYTDFDLVEHFPGLDLISSSNRSEMIDLVVQFCQPAGRFWVRIETDDIKLDHQYGDQMVHYKNLAEIKSIVDQGQLYFGDEQINSIGLYQLAFLFQPEYFKQTYGITIFSSTVLELLWDLFTFVIGQIGLNEAQTGQTYRFGPRYELFNAYLDSTDSQISPSTVLEQMLEDVHKKSSSQDRQTSRRTERQTSRRTDQPTNRRTNR